MADLKINERDLVGVLERAATGALQGLKDFAHRAVEEVKLVAAALEQMPKSTNELFTRAAIARVYDGNVHSDQAEVRIGVETQGMQLDTGNHYYDNPGVKGLKPGRYRVLVFMLPVAGGESDAK